MSQGWNIEGKHVLPLEAYTDSLSWLSHFESVFPDKAKRMRRYSAKQSWSPTAHAIHWLHVVPGWLDKHGEKL